MALVNPQRDEASRRKRSNLERSDEQALPNHRGAPRLAGSSTASHGCMRNPTYSPRDNSTARIVSATEDGLRNPRPIGVPRCNGFSVTGSSRIDDSPGMSISSSDG